MFKRNETTNMAGSKNASETIIAHGVRVEGDFTSDGDVIIEGEVNGSVKTSQNLRIGSASKIKADVFAENAVVAGEVHGNLSIGQKLELAESANIQGDIDVDVLIIAPGAKINGRVSMGGDRKKTSVKKEVVEEAVNEYDEE